MLLAISGLLGSILGVAAPVARADTPIVVYGPERMYGGDCVLEASFQTTTSWGRRYIVEVTNGSPGATAISVFIDGQEWVGQSELGGWTSVLSRIVDIQDGIQNHSMDICVWGSSSAYVDVRIYHVTEPTFVVYGPHTFVKLTPAAVESTSFLNSPAATSPYLLRVRNGAGDGSNRVSNGKIWLNDVEVVSPSDRNLSTTLRHWLREFTEQRPCTSPRG